MCRNPRCNCPWIDVQYIVDENTAPSAIYGYFVLIDFGGGSIMQAAYSIAPAKIIHVGADIPPVIGFINVPQIGRIIHSLAISGVVFQKNAFDNLNFALVSLGFTEQQIRAAIAGTDSTVFENITPA